ncbi:phage head spike fiber domain-containing protein [Rhizobium straminoryzae]|uniref:Uncharacterized protein n=1 Tax=Rhizobium straminoryzae TaxID=1387186 RepID=A0A549T0S3_9HYPH|nr:hypothetical protein [Rhizobium straminoryzae]TRL35479.1 hypothetical protein FNA46_19960 [Rhizobium straminoryzae]
MGKLRLGRRRGIWLGDGTLSLSQGGWWSSTAMRLDGAAPSVVIDLNNDRYALPTLGPEMLVNGDFSQGAVGWVANSGTTLAVVNGSAGVTATSAGTSSIAAAVNVTVGSLYRVSGRLISATSAAGLAIMTAVNAGTFASTTPALTAGVYEFYFVATQATMYVGPRIFSAAVGAATTWDDVSVREVQLNRLTRAAFAECFTFSASSTVARTYIDKAGIMRNDLAADQPRFGWKAGKRRLLLEDTATNALTQSGNLLDAAWSFFFLSVASVDANKFGPGFPAFTLRENATNGVHALGRAGSARPAIISGQSYVDTYCLAADGREWLLYENNATGSYKSVYVNIATRTVGANGFGSAISVKFTDGPAGFVLVSFVFTSTVNSALDGSLFLTTGDGAGKNYVGDTAKGIQFGWRQVETGSAPTSYIPTAGSAVTRTIETARFSPLVEAIIQRAAATIRVQYQLYEQTNVQRVIGGVNPTALVGDSGVGRVSNWNGSTTLATAVGQGASLIVPTSSIIAWNAAGRSLVTYLGPAGGVVASDGNQPGDRSLVYLGRGSVVGVNPGYGDGFYDTVTIWPIRGADASIQALAVPA